MSCVEVSPDPLNLLYTVDIVKFKLFKYSFGGTFWNYSTSSRSRTSVQLTSGRLCFFEVLMSKHVTSMLPSHLIRKGTYLSALNRTLNKMYSSVKVLLGKITQMHWSTGKTQTCSYLGYCSTYMVPKNWKKLLCFVLTLGTQSKPVPDYLTFWRFKNVPKDLRCVTRMARWTKMWGIRNDLRSLLYNNMNGFQEDPRPKSKQDPNIQSEILNKSNITTWVIYRSEESRDQNRFGNPEIQETESQFWNPQSKE